MAGTNIQMKQAPWYGGGLAQALQPGACEGDVIYVDGTSGDDGQLGRMASTPVLTMLRALALCTHGYNDTIIVLRYPSAGAVGEAWPIVVNKGNVHIIGNPFEASHMKIFHNPAADTPAFQITVNEVEIAGIEVGGGATDGCIETSGAVYRLNIHHCDFGWQYASQDGIRFPGTDDVPHAWIHDNRFNDNLTRDGIRVEHNSTRSVFERNLFRLVGGIGIHLQGLCTDIYGIFDNRFRVADSATGEAITFLNVNSERCMIDGNRTMEGQVQMGLVPYRDLGDNHWGLNYYSIIAIMPVTV